MALIPIPCLNNGLTEVFKLCLHFGHSSLAFKVKWKYFTVPLMLRSELQHACETKRQQHIAQYLSATGVTSALPRRHLGSQLCELEKLIDKMMVEDFTMYARSDLSRSLREEPLVLEKVGQQRHTVDNDHVFI